MHTVNAGLQFTVPISQSFIFKMSLCCVLAAPSCQFRPTKFEQTETAVKQNVITDVPSEYFNV